MGPERDLSWAEHMQAALDARELWWGFVESDEPPPQRPPPYVLPNLGTGVSDPSTPSKPAPASKPAGSVMTGYAAAVAGIPDVCRLETGQRRV